MKRSLTGLVVVISLALLAGCGNKQQAPEAAGRGRGGGALPVKTEVAQVKRVGDVTEYVATVKSRDASVLQPQVHGQIVKIFVHSGQKVRAGEPLIQIDP